MPGLRDKLNQPTVDNPEGGVGTFIWEKIVKRTPGYAYEVFDALSPLKTRDIDWKKDAAFGVLPLQVPPLAKGVWQLGTEAVTGYAASATGGDKANKQRRRRRLDISLQLFKDEKAQKLSPEEKASLRAELDDLFNQDFMGYDKEDLRPRDLLSIAGRQYPTWQALYSDLRDTIPGAPELEAIVLMEPDKIPEATQRWMDKWKNEPLDLISLALGVTKSRLLMKAGKLRKTATAKKSTDAGKLIAQAEQYENAAKWVGRANPEEAPAGIMAAGIKSLSPPGMQAYNPEVEGTYGVDPDTGRPLTTTMQPEQFGEQLGIDKDVLPIAVLSDYDYGAMVEGWARFYDRRGALKINPTELREDTVSGAARRFLVAKQMIQDQRRTHAEGLADDLGVPRTHTTDPHAAGKAGIEVFQGWQARQDRQANDIAKTIADGTSDPHDAGNLAHTHYEDWQLGKKTEFEKEFGEIDEALDAPLRSLTEAPPEAAPTPETPPGLLTTTRAKLDELRAADSKLLSDPDLEKVAQIIDNIVEEAAQDGLTLHDFDKMRTNFRKRLASAVQNGEMTPIGKGQVEQLFYGTLTEDFYNLIEAEIAIDPTAFPEGFTVEKIRAAKADYRTTVVDLENSPAAVFLRRTQSKPAALIDELLKEKGVFNKDQLDTLKTILGDDGWKALQPALLDRFIGEATNPQTGNIYRDRLEKMIDKLNGTDKEKANRLLGAENVDKLRQMAKRTDIENSNASKYLKKMENAPAALIDELLKTKGVFDPDEIANLKLILGEDGFRELQPGLLGRIYEMAAKNEKKLPENIDATGLRGMLDTITRRDKNKLIDIFGEETAEFLEQSALFAERFGRAKPWHKGSPQRNCRHC